MAVFQRDILLPAYKRGFHLIDAFIERELANCTILTGVCHIFIHHTSAALTINENADPSVRSDFETFINHLVPESFSGFRHVYEGNDDMPAHIKSSLFASSVSFPFRNGKIYTGTWQGVYLCEFRNHGGRRKITVTITGE